MRLIVMGPPGAGKGTQASHIATYYGIPAISTGDIFRANVSAGTDLGVTAQQYMNAGEYVPDEITNAMVRARLLEPDAAAGFLLDGYPRTAAQVDELDAMLKVTGHELDAVIVLTVDTDELVGRLLNRAQVDGRADDTEEVIRRRQEVYLTQTEALIDIYRWRRLLHEVDGIGDVSDVTQRVFDALPGGRGHTVLP
ncbi:MAG: adenylate kinase [Jiangellaceae bacterium]